MNTETVIMATKEPRLSLSDILASIGNTLLDVKCHNLTSDNYSKNRWLSWSVFGNEYFKPGGIVILGV